MILISNYKGEQLKPRGTKDIFGKQKEVFSYVEKTLNLLASNFNFNSIETPTFEFKDVYTKTIGQESDIVSKEMYIFKDKKNRELALRPEGTAGVIRAVIQNKLLTNANSHLKLFYNGSFFRYERPQKGRQREFHQAGFEVLGSKNYLIDLEVILLGVSILNKLKIPYQLQINSLGSRETKAKFQNELKNYFSNHQEKLSQQSRKRMLENPLRILDDKLEQKKPFVKNAPLISEFYSESEKKYFAKIVKTLKKFSINFQVNPLLVRGLDYYTETTFEFIATSESEKAKDTLIGGGRYDNFVDSFSKEKVSGIGFGIGIERIVNEIEDLNLFKSKKQIDFFVLNLKEVSSLYAFEITQKIRQLNFRVETNINKPLTYSKGLQKANKLNAKYVCLVDEKLEEQKSVMIKTKNSKEIVNLKHLDKFLQRIKDEKNTK